MFRSGQTNPFDEVVTKATDENLTSENWQLILDVCDQVDSKPEDGPRDAIAAVTKRFAHRNANVQLYALTLAEALGKNCGTKVHREIASRTFTQAILRLINDRTTHNTVKSRAYELVTQWTEEFKKDPSLGIMDETLRQLRSSNPSIQPPSRPQKREITDADRKKEEDELQMALALSLSDTHISQPSTSQPQGYNPPQQQQQFPQQPQQQQAPIQKSQTTAATVSRVKALYDFSPSEPSELPFRRGDIISVLDSVYKDWWRGSLRGQTGIFPVNYVEILKDATPEELMREAEEESKILAEGRNIEKLLGLLANAEGGRGVEDEDLQGLYNSTLAIRPKLVKLIEKYSMRKDELIALNEKFHKARHDYDVLMESSMSRYSRPAPAPSTNPFGQAQPYPTSFHQPTQPTQRPLSGTGYPPNPTTNSPPPGPGYPQGSPVSSFPPAANWDANPQAKPWDNAPPPSQVQAPQPQSNPWETHQQPTTNTSAQWDSQYQPQWDQERPAPPSTYQGPSQSQPPQYYGGGLDDLAGQPADQQQQYPHWYEPPSGPPPGSNPALSTSSPLPPANTGTAPFPPQSSTTAAPAHPYFSPQASLNPSNPEPKPDSRHQHTYSQSADQSSYPPPPPSQAPPAIPFEQKPQSNPPYPTGKNPQSFYSTPPKPPATYSPQGQGDKYASLRSLSPSNQESSGSGGWYTSSGSQEQKETGKPFTDDVHNGGGGPGYYGAP